VIDFRSAVAVRALDLAVVTEHLVLEYRKMSLFVNRFGLEGVEKQATVTVSVIKLTG
jgi:hypothetical protein